MRVLTAAQLQRHGARFPTSGSGTRIQSAVNKLIAVRRFNDPRLDFLRTFTYDLGTSDLVPFGAAQYVIPLNEEIFP